MATEFKLPNIGEGIDSADVAEILVAVGDTVDKGQILMELETDKAVVELPSGVAGEIESIAVQQGDSIAVGDVVLTVSSNSAASKAEPPAEPEAPAAAEPEASETPKESTAESPAAAGGGETLEFKLPNIGEGIDSADVAELLVNVGDVIEPKGIVAELETDKAVVELPLESGGTIVEILISEGDSISVGQHILTVKTGSGSPTAKSEKPKEPAANTPSPKSASSDSDTKSRPAMATPAKGTVVETTAVASRDAASSDGPPPPAAPSTRRLARELGVNLREVSGNGPGGRILNEDVHAFVKQRMTSMPANLPAVASAGGGAMALAPPPLPDFTNFGTVSREKLSKLGRTAAENLTTAWHVIPHVTQQDVCDITDLEAARKKFGAGAGAKGPKVTMTAIAMKALATCLEAFPKFNSSLDPETMEIVYKEYINIGCAVDTPYGLVVPVIKDCNHKSIIEIAADLTDLAVKARDRKLAMDEMMGATCTVTNLGGIGGTAFTPIVNYPEVAILGMCRGQKQPAIQDGQLVERLMLPLSMSYDHRVINGADAAKFLVAFKNMLADPFQLMASA